MKRRLLGTMALACAVASGTEGNAVTPQFEADFSPAGTNVSIIDYSQRTSPVRRLRGGVPLVEFSRPIGSDKADTLWGIETKTFAVTAGDAYVVLIEMEGDVPARQGKPGAEIAWYDASGCSIQAQDAAGRTVALTSRLVAPTRRMSGGRAIAYSLGRVPEGVVRARLSHKVDFPDLAEGKKVAIRRMAYFERPWGSPSPFGDTQPPELQILNQSPSTDRTTPLRFRLTDASGIDWSETAIRIDGKAVRLDELKRSGDVFAYSPATTWEKDSIHRIETDAVDMHGNCGYDCGFVAFTDRRPAHPKCMVRDDGMILVDGKPTFLLGWCRVRPCEGNDYDLDKGVAEMKANGMNIAHTYMVRGMGSAREQELFDELVAACERHGIMLYAEPADRNPHGENFMPLVSKNLMRGLGYRMPLFWGIGDDTSKKFTPDDLKYCHRCCKAVDPHALTSSADVTRDRGLFVPYVPYADVFFLESYPIRAAEPEDDEMAKAANVLDNAWGGTQDARIAGRTVAVMPQVFKGWGNWKRLPTEEEVRCQTYLAIAGRARGLVFYASCGNRSNVNVPPAPGQKIELMNHGPLNLPAYKEMFLALTRELARLGPSLAGRDAARQPTIRVIEGPARNGRASASIRCLLKEDGLLVAANTAHVRVLAEIALPDGRTMRHEFPRNGVLVMQGDGK